jgi:hypothetical protein
VKRYQPGIGGDGPRPGIDLTSNWALHEAGATVATLDCDFARFDSVRHVRPGS